jgi:hypothetical protein
MPTNPSIPTHSVRAAAAAYIEMGMIPVPVPVRRKGPVVADWPDLRFTPADLSDWFPDDRTGNVGLNLVVNLADMDLDSAEAVAAGNRWLPWTGWVSGRTNKPRSHHWYRPAGPVRYLEFNDVDGSRILELRTGAGLQTVVPPGIHELGDEIVWHTFDGDPAVVPGADLMRLAGEVAALSILIRHWPVKGNRDNAHLGLIGGLLRAGWTVSRVEALVAAVADLTDDEEARRRVAKVARSEERLKSNDPTRGWPTLERCLTGDGAEVVKRVRTWLNLAVEASGGQAEPAAEPWAPPVPLGDVPNVAPFPADVFPPAVADFAGHVAASMNCPFDYVAAGVLGIAGAALGAARRLEVKPGFAVLPNLYIAPVAPPGSAKSPAQTAVVKPLVEIDADLDRASREARREYRLALEDYKDDLKEWRKKKEGRGRSSRSCRTRSGPSSGTSPASGSAACWP